MGIWSSIFGVNHAGDIPNANPPTSVGPGSYDPGEEGAVNLVKSDVEGRALPAWHPSPWSGWPSNWSTPNWDFGSRFNELVDVAWMCIDRNASALMSMPVYRTVAGQIAEPASWMVNPDPSIYTSWHEFAKQLFWDYQLGEAFVMEVASFADGFPMRFRVVPPWAFHVEMKEGRRRYFLGGIEGPDVTDAVLHIRYKSTTDGTNGHGPLEVAGGRMLTAGLIAKYVRDMASTGGVPVQTIEAEVPMTNDEAQKLLDNYMAARLSNSNAPPVFDSGAKLVDHPAIPPKDMAMMELEQFNESRIASLLGVPPFLVGLPSGGDSMTYSNVSSLFDYHDRQTLGPAAKFVTGALSYWALPRGQAVELNRDEYSRPSFDVRAEAWTKFVAMGATTPEQVARYERFQGVSPEQENPPDQVGQEAAMTEITGGEQ